MRIPVASSSNLLRQQSAVLVRSSLRRTVAPSTASRSLQTQASSVPPSYRDPSHAPPKSRGGNKVYASADEAVKDIKSGSIILSAGFGICGTAETIIAAMKKRTDLTDLTAVSNNAGTNSGGGLQPLVTSGQLSKVILSFLGGNKALEAKYFAGELSVELCPQGSIAERVRAAGAGIPAFYTPTGVSTLVQTGGIPIRYGPVDDKGKRTVAIPGNVRETKVFNGRTYMLETAIKGDVCILRCDKVDKAGNCVFKGTTKAFGIPMAKSATVTIVEADNIVEIGELDPAEIHLPGIFVDRIVPSTVPKEIEIMKLAEAEGESAEASDTSPGAMRRKLIAKRAAKELKDGYYVNLGVGMPTLAASYLDPSIQVWIQSENGLLGMGPYPASEAEADPDLINAGKETVTLLPGASLFDSSESFGMIRGGHVDVSMLGALQVDAAGNLANYMIPEKLMKGMGGAMDLVSNPDGTKIIVLTDHTDKNGKSKIVEQCTLPLTGAKVVSRIITELCVFDCDRENGGLTLIELAPGIELEEVQKKTGAKFAVAEHVGRMDAA